MTDSAAPAGNPEPTEPTEPTGATGSPGSTELSDPAGPAGTTESAGTTEPAGTTERAGTTELAGMTKPPGTTAPGQAAPASQIEDAPDSGDLTTPPEAAAAPAAASASRSLTYAVDLVYCIDVTGSMTPILDAVKANALRFYQDVQTNLTEKGKNVDELRVRVIAFRDLAADPESALKESSFFSLPDEQTIFSAFVENLTAEGGGDAPESGLEALALAINSPWTSRGDRRRQVIVVWTDQPAHPLNFAALPPDLASSVPSNFSALTDLWEDPQGPVGTSTKRLILFAPDGPGWSDISASWENVVHHPSEAGGGLSEVDYGTIVDSIGNSV